MQTEVDALRASLDSTPIDVADIIGMSHGGVIGLVFALENPRRVRTLTLIDPPAFWVLPNHGYDDAGARQMRLSMAPRRWPSTGAINAVLIRTPH